MKKKLILLGVLMMGSFSTVHSAPVPMSTGGGNGGDVFICNNPKQNMILDYFEGKDKWLYEDFGDPILSVRENLNHWYENLVKVDPYRANNYLKFFNTFLEDLEKIENKRKDTSLISFTNGTLIDIPDSLEIVIPEGCVKHQIAVQTNKFLGEKAIKIQANLWESIDDRQKAILIAHEAVYTEFLKAGARDSREARYFNQLVMSGKLGTEISGCKYLEIINKFQNNALNSIGMGILDKEDDAFKGIVFSAKNVLCSEDTIKISNYKFNIPGLKTVDGSNEDAFLRFDEVGISSSELGFYGVIDPITIENVLVTNGKKPYRTQEFRISNDRFIKLSKQLSFDLTSIFRKSLQLYFEDVNKLDVYNMYEKKFLNDFIEDKELVIKFDNESSIELMHKENKIILKNVRVRNQYYYALESRVLHDNLEIFGDVIIIENEKIYLRVLKVNQIN